MSLVHTFPIYTKKRILVVSTSLVYWYVVCTLGNNEGLMLRTVDMTSRVLKNTHFPIFLPRISKEIVSTGFHTLRLIRRHL